jgi:hypothetical protein
MAKKGIFKEILSVFAYGKYREALRAERHNSDIWQRWRHFLPLGCVPGR